MMSGLVWNGPKTSLKQTLTRIVCVLSSACHGAMLLWRNPWCDDEQVYHYNLDTTKWRSPFRSRFSAHHRGPLDLAVLRQAAALFVGTHDFAHFSNLDATKAGRSTVKTIRR